MTPSVLETDQPSLREEWDDFVDLLERALAEYRRRPFRSHRQAFNEFHRVVCGELRATETLNSLVRAWRHTEGRGSSDPEFERTETGELLRLELRSVNAELRDLVGPLRTDTPYAAPRVTRGRPFRLPQKLRSWLGLKEAIKAGGTLMGSLKDLLEAGPDWLKALLTIGKEAIDVVTEG